MPASLRSGDRTEFCGDSITADGWYVAAGSLIDQLGTLGASLTLIHSGVGGNKAADIAAAVTTRIIDNTPNVLVLQVGVNDATAGTSASSFRASYDSILSQSLAWSPGLQIVCVSILCYGELWASVNGPRFAGNPYDSTIDTLNNEIRGSATQYGATYCDVRTPGAIYESTHNTPEPGSTPSFLTNDNLHPVLAGQVVMGTAAYGCFNLPGNGATRNYSPQAWTSARGVA